MPSGPSHPNTIVIVTADNGTWLDAYPDAGTTPFRGEKGSRVSRAAGACPASCGGRITSKLGRELQRDDVAHRCLGDAGRDGRPHYRRRTNGWAMTPSRSISTVSTTVRTSLGKASHSARNFVDLYRRRGSSKAARADIGGDPKEPWLHIAWKYLYTAKDSWLGTEANLGCDWRDVQSHDGSVREVRGDL